MRTYMINENDDDASIDYTLKIIKKAQKWAIFYDYGELSPTNLYATEAVADSLIEKLNTFPGFELSMVFRNEQNEIEKLPLIKRIRQWQEAGESAKKAKKRKKVQFFAKKCIILTMPSMKTKSVDAVKTIGRGAGQFSCLTCRSLNPCRGGAVGSRTFIGEFFNLAIIFNQEENL